MSWISGLSLIKKYLPRRLGISAVANQAHKHTCPICMDSISQSRLIINVKYNRIKCLNKYYLHYENQLIQFKKPE
jgi:hypothetical protein